MINRMTYGIGLILLFTGVLGFFPGYGLLHAVIGVWALYASSDYRNAKLFNQISTVLFAGLALFAFIPAGDLNPFFGIAPLYGNDVWFHAVIAIVVGYFGFMWVEKKHFSPAPKPTH